MIRFYYGENGFEVNRQITQIKNQFAKDYGIDNIVKVMSHSIEEIQSELTSAGLFSSERLVVLENVFTNKVLIERLPAILPLISEGTQLVIGDVKPDKRTKLYKMLAAGETKEYTLPKNLRTFVANEAKKQDIKIDTEAITKIITYTNGDMWRIANEITKFKTSNLMLSQENIIKYVEPDLAVNAFQVLDDIFNQRPNQAIDKIKTLQYEEDPNKFFAFLSSQFFALSVAKNSNKSKEITAKEAGVHPYVMSNMFYSARKIAEEKITIAARIIAETDLKIKQSTKEEGWAFIELAINRI